VKTLSLAVLLAGSISIGAAPAIAQTAIFAGGCFWCVESDFDKVPGVTGTTSGYIGGTTENPTYEQVTYEDTGHYEAVLITYDPDVVSYEALLTTFWHTVDPTDAGGQFCDRGDSYRTAIFPVDAEQAELAEASKAAIIAESGYDIVTPILPGHAFYEAEGYHQDYYINNPVRYNYYRFACGRNARVDELWGENAFLGTDINPLP
jgi:peptide-methionine (S)-S-oxide reductase